MAFRFYLHRSAFSFNFFQQKSSKDFPYMKDDSVSENFEDDIKSGEGF